VGGDRKNFARSAFWLRNFSRQSFPA